MQRTLLFKKFLIASPHSKLFYSIDTAAKDVFYSFETDLNTFYLAPLETDINGLPYFTHHYGDGLTIRFAPRLADLLITTL